jgi:UDP-2,3-diacylglucosamine pyrophosphatase LpxH
MEETFYSRQLVDQAKKFKQLKAYVVSDVHLNDHPYDNGEVDENPRRKHFREFLTKLRLSHNDETEQLMVILNGDIMDITGSWFGPLMPWDEDTHQVETTLLETLNRILDNNRSICDELTRLLAFNNVQIFYIIGNHDGMLNLFPRAKNLILERIGPDQKSHNQILFMNSLESPELGLYVEHGQRFDPFNHTDAKNRFCLGDYINILLINGFKERVINSLYSNGYSEDVINMLREQLHDIEYLRPLTLVPLWIRTTADQYKHHPENKGKKESIDSIIISVTAEIFDANTTRPLIEKLNLPRKFMSSLLHWFIHLPGTLPIVTFLIGIIYRRTHNNRYQYSRAQRLHKYRGYRFIAFGHTHGPSVMSLSQDAYYFNTGSWKPVIYLFKHLEFDQTNLEALNPFVKFNKIEHSGILSIEKDLTDPASVPVFSLQTTQSNHPYF